MVQVPIIQDSLLESTEQFSANLALVDNNGISVIVDPALTTVNIMQWVSQEFRKVGEREGLQIGSNIQLKQISNAKLI